MPPDNPLKASTIEVAVSSDPSMFDLVVGILSGLGFDGFWEDDGVLRCYVAAAHWSPSLRTVVQQSIHNLFVDHPAPRISITTQEHRNWNEEWEKSIQPIKVSEHVVITPSWRNYPPSKGEIVITIDPKMSFGTGYHESTRIVLQMMERHMRPGDQVLDIGTGTGILAIAAVTLGAGSAVGVDTDEWAFENARENVLANRAASVTILHGSLDVVSDGTFDLILANLQRNVILDLLSDITRRLRNGGIALFSGLLSADEDHVARELESSGFTILEILAENDWIGIAATHHGPGAA